MSSNNNVNITESSYEIYRGNEYEENEKYDYIQETYSENKRFPRGRNLTPGIDGDLNYGLSSIDHTAFLNVEIARYFIILSMMFSLLTTAIGITTWILIPKWRIFKNYVLVTIIFHFTVLYCLIEIKDLATENYTLDWTNITMDFFLSSFCWWLVVASVRNYRDLVVFKCNISRIMLKTNLLVWTSSLLTTTMDEISWIAARVSFIKLIIPLLIGCFLFGVVILLLIKEEAPTAQSKRHRMQAAALTFLVSSVMMLSATLITDSYAALKLLRNIGTCIYVVQSSVVNLIFLLLKTNRQSWHDYYKNIKNSFE